MPTEQRWLITSGWLERPVVAVCDNDECPWEYRGVSAVRTENEADDHVLKMGHEVTVYREQRKTIGLGAS